LLVRAEEEPVVVIEVEASSTPPPIAAEEGQTAAGAAAPQAALEPPTEADPGSGDVVVVLDKDSVPRPSSGDRDVVMTLVSEPASVVVMADPFPVVEVPEPSPAAEVSGPSPTAEEAETYSVTGAITVEEVMELAMCRYIDFPGVGVTDLEAPQLLEKVLDVATEQMFAEPSIMETIASVSQALQQYEPTGGFARSAVPKAAETVPEESAAGTESVADASAPRRLVRGRKRPFPSQQKMPDPQPPPQRRARQRVLSKRRGRRCPARSPPVPMMFACRMSPTQPFRSESLPRTRQGPLPRRSKRSRRWRA
jgi:hypothetical protein